MATLSDPKETIAVLNRYGFRFKKNFGQNFLIDSRVLDKIIRAAEITSEDTVLEIGPGIGTMTQALLEAAGEVIAVEIDSSLIPILREDTCRGYDNLTLINEDVLKLNLGALSESRGGKKFKVVANLPYYITTPIIMGLFEKHVPVESITVMVQKEVAERMQAGPGTKDYGALSLAVQYYSEPCLAARVPQNCFIPRPNVDSAVIRLRVYPEPPVRARDEKLLFSLIRAAFSQRRKTFANAAGNSQEVPFTREQVGAALSAIGKSENIRGEAMTLAEFAALSDRLSECDTLKQGK